MNDLVAAYTSVAERLPSSGDTAAWAEAEDSSLYCVSYRRGDLPSPPADCTTSDLYVVRGTHIYPSLAVDVLHVFASRETYRCLGLWVISALLEPEPARYWMRLAHPASSVKQFCISTEYRSLEGESPGLYTQPHAVVYHPRMLTGFPLSQEGAGTGTPLPELTLTDYEDLLDGFDEGEARDTIIGCGSDTGAWLFAELLLNVSQPWNDRVEYELEGPFGFGGVAAASAEVRLWLPGSSAWDPHQW